MTPPTLTPMRSSRRWSSGESRSRRASLRRMAMAQLTAWAGSENAIRVQSPMDSATPAAVLLRGREEELPPQAPEPEGGVDIVPLDVPAVAHDVGGEDGEAAPLDARLRAARPQLVVSAGA